MVDRLYLGVDLGGTDTKIACVSEEGQIVERSKIPTRATRPADEVVRDIAAECLRLRDLVENQVSTVVALGIGIPGLIDWEKGICKLLPNFAHKWKGVPIKAWMERQISLPVGIINDVRAITLAEKRFGAGKNVKTMVMIAIGTGIGGGVVIDGDLYIGQDGGAGEFGHITVEPTGILCGCGNRGCLESYASGPAIISQAVGTVIRQNDTKIRDLVDGNIAKITPKIVEEAALSGDPIAKGIYRLAGLYIGQALGNVCLTVNPKMIVIGGGVARAGELLFDGIREGLRNRLFLIPVDTIDLASAQLEMDAGVIGTATWVKEQMTKGKIGSFTPKG
ncbi:MAG TPA: ROK family protein [Atribacteraceae bacterium]|nr:ROK family protein [Atribacteraceae bacterium]